MARCIDNNGVAYRCNSAWYDWGRWVALAIIILGAFLIFFLFSLWSARRRRRMGRQPLYGTGWTGRTPWGHGAAQYNPGYQQTQQPSYQAAPPAYNQTQSYGGYYGQNQGYFGGRQTDVEMQPPQNTYRGGDNVYAPPTSPPPAKK
ncbi:uncharacterized protein Z519_00742 [Cladophialophora bantiana CBS 173.52]|uniref:Uncharacterized protein n=1 Tax=Cladophialophora bantiana (strain ATCC 10958 / CBS 173.52 / CDC B-1940 / NIH 8579) TaxID=1442370 RepID=A0A0D2IQT6_CLAB1|nr:uncharacterized protein Z519_00742 [Cladophialophora bantiana CBS 173.52]KIW99079.1 hypothetical protein Z519_00742 [Cladophialophora bantiana CBS 173.52]